MIEKIASALIISCLFNIILPARGFAETQVVRINVLEKYHPEKLLIESNAGEKHVLVIDVNTALPVRLSNASVYDIHVVGRDIVRSYEGELLIRRKGHGLQIINSVALEHYVQSVVLSELGWSERQAMQAQAVLARSWALSHIRPEHEFDFGDLTSSQVYKGVIRQARNIADIVRATENQILTYNNILIDVYYHARCSDRVFSAHEVWGGDNHPYLAEVQMPESGVLSSGGKYWGKRISKSALGDIFKVEQQESSELVIIKQYRSGHAGIKVNEQWYGIDTFRIMVNRKLGWNQIKSNDFELYDRGASIDFKGKGFGHLVGMCQQNAVALAGNGWNYRQILELFYPGTEIQHIQ